MRDIAQRLTTITEDLKQERRMTRAAFAASLNVSKSVVSKWCAGEVANLKHVHLYAIERLYGYSARWIALGEGPRTTAELADALARDVIAKKMANGELLDISDLSPAAQKALRMMAEACRSNAPTDPQHQHLT